MLMTTIRAKLGAVLAALVLLVAIVAGMGVQSLRQVDDASEEIRHRWMPALVAVGEVAENFTRYRQLHGVLILSPDAAREREVRNLAEARRVTEEAWRAVQRLVATPEQRALAARVEASMLAYYALDTRLNEILRGGDSAAASRFYAGEMRTAFSPTRIGLNELQENLAAEAAAASSLALTIYRRAFYLLGGLALFAVLVGLGAMAWLDRGTARPLAALSGRMRGLAEGDKQSEVPATDKKDEVGAMARAVEGFRLAAIEQERQATAAIAEQAAKAARAERVDQLVRHFEEEAAGMLRVVASAATELDATAAEMQATAEQGAQRATSMGAAAEEASANVQTVAASTEELSASVKEVARQVTESAQVARQAAEDARATDAAVASLAEAAQRIGDVVRLISGIAAQTNLLALNATIEAARAGEAGKGFAVVASEVKQLASQTAKATEEIGAQITTMQAETDRAVDAIRGIARTIEGMDSRTAQLAAAAEQQASAVQEIGRASAEAAAGTTEVSSHAGGVATGAQQTGAAATQVRASSGELARSAEGLRSKVDGFLTGIRAA
jgi:methyl-accepting chemotaxis protein